MTWFWVTRLIVEVTVIRVTVIRMLREAAAARPLSWINPPAGGGAAWALGLKAWLGIRRFELADALVVRQCGGSVLSQAQARKWQWSSDSELFNSRLNYASKYPVGGHCGAGGANV
ncbi:hypothetical protein B0T22DRAFT_445847 [Podospora appendiculata]|uniref:Uncharacterized protein n=1 Tax=Podospora appendiculata TaxID=314037 RepID=A0AAE0WYW4_9PEZI|nr:hypothetical protein B0T22DRAFT_445847 [Podospora appendiculata]